jgi:hypothetical protein
MSHDKSCDGGFTNTAYHTGPPDITCTLNHKMKGGPRGINFSRGAKFEPTHLVKVKEGQKSYNTKRDTKQFAVSDHN